MRQPLLGERGLSQPSAPPINEQGTIAPLPPVCQRFSFSQRKGTALHFHPRTQETPLTPSCILLSTVSHQFLYPLDFHLKSTVLYIYYTRFFFFTVNVFFCAAP